jgi:hypothetical protein
MDNEELIAKISREVEHMCVTTGLNCAHDYDGIESKEDILLYLRAIHRLLPQKSIGEVYVKNNKTIIADDSSGLI